MYLKVFVTPGARRERVEEKDDILVVAVREPAAGNRANKRVREIVATRSSVPVGRVRILTGHRSRSKIVSIDN
ncbi:MAG TPA: DUF167 domain-containing protein [Candidatus Paceibacterota bacterium]|nr:DUF167 domain-containing protein [Candidatus Paceibacterota bacterium]